MSGCWVFPYNTPARRDLAYRVLGGPQSDVHDGPTLRVVDLLAREHGRALSGDVCGFRKVEEHVLRVAAEGEVKQRESQTCTAQTDLIG